MIENHGDFKRDYKGKARLRANPLMVFTDTQRSVFIVCMVMRKLSMRPPNLEEIAEFLKTDSQHIHSAVVWLKENQYLTHYHTPTSRAHSLFRGLRVQE